ncbi:MAG: phosphatidate cytidylyltransferase [Bacilli bacterium]|nr:phosphatidate cytidylyltransferase [Bacilli bacterium]MBN2697151.1 phosphatidate cytidylyltransferase [Bacilli bacterium]
MKQRIITALLMALIYIPILIFGGRFHLFFAFTGVLVILGAWEFRKMLRQKRQVSPSFDYLTIGLTLATYAIGYLGLTGIIGIAYLGLGVFSLVLIYLLIYVLDKDLDVADISLGLLTILYIAGGFTALAYLRQLGLWVIAYALLVAILTDTFAYFIGIKFGRHRLAVLISPKKSVEGAVAGLVLGGGLAAVFALVMNVFSIHFLYVFLLSFYLSAVGQIGDLIASKFKRDHEIKDFSNLLPGHGGILDRFDSWIIIALDLLVTVKLLSMIFGVQVF